MTKIQRIKSFISGIFMIILAIPFLIDPTDGYYFIMLMLGFVFAFRGLKLLFYYVTMARYMVGGSRVLFSGILIFDFGLFTITLNDMPHLLILLYLVVLHIFAGLVTFVNALDIRRRGSKSWRLKLSTGLVNIVAGILCLVLLKESIAVYIYCAGMVYGGIMRIVTAFRKNREIVIID